MKTTLPWYSSLQLLPSYIDDPWVILASRLIWLEKCYFWFCFSTQTLCRLVLWFLAATAALEVQMLVCLCVTLVWFGGLCLIFHGRNDLHSSDLSKLFLLYSKVTSGMKLMLGFEIIFHKNTDQRMKWGLPLCSNEVNVENPLKSQLLSNKLFEMVFCIILINQHLTRLGGRNSDVSVR